MLVIPPEPDNEPNSTTVECSDQNAAATVTNNTTAPDDTDEPGDQDANDDQEGGDYDDKGKYNRINDAQ